MRSNLIAYNGGSVQFSIHECKDGSIFYAVTYGADARGFNDYESGARYYNSLVSEADMIPLF